MNANVADVAVKTKPVALQYMETSLADVAVKLSQFFGPHVKVTLMVENLDNVTLLEAAEYTGQQVTRNYDHQCVSIKVGDKDLLHLDNGGLPF